MARRPRKKTSSQPSTTLTGTIRMHPRGFGFVILDDPKASGDDVFIPKRFTENAVDGDRVEILTDLQNVSEKGPEGKITAILERSKSHIAGTVTNVKEKEITAFAPILGETKSVLVQNVKKVPLSVGDRLKLKVIDWGSAKQPVVCEIIERIGHIDDPSCDIRAAVLEHDLPDQFENAVVQEAKSFGDSVKRSETEGRLDLSKTACFTIDPDTAKDFDDALSISKDKKGHFFLGVHIADVSHYVKPESALDKEAFKRSNSTYFPGKCIPMLPEELSNNLCSLRQGVIRLTVSVLMEFDPQGAAVKSQVKRTFINSLKRFTYDEAKQVLDGKKKSPYEKDLHNMAQLCQLLKKKRSDRGSIDFALPELILVVDENGKPTGTKIEEYHITHQLVEEFMLKANEMVAVHLKKRGKTPLFRVHEEPDEENMEEFFKTARGLGFTLPPKPSQADIQSLFHKAKDGPYSQQLAIGFIRNLKLAIYSPNNVGHFGLALEDYCHFTSPIRRYSDLVVQRLLFDEEPKDLDLSAIGKHCSDRERISFKAEMSVRGLKKLRLLKQWQNEDPQRTYKAYVTKCKAFGIFFEIRDLFLEGSLHVSELVGDYYVFDQEKSLFTGEKTGKSYAVGQELEVHPAQIDLIYLETKWELAHTKRKRRARKKRD